MKSKRSILATLAVAALVGLVAALPAPAAARDVDKTVQADKDGLVIVENIAGSIRVEGWDRAEVKITGTLGDDVEDLEVKAGGNKTRIKVEYPRKRGNIDAGADLVIMAPRGSSLEIECVSAPITVVGMAGDVEAASISGDVEIGTEGRRVEAETISGTLTVAAARAEEVSVHSISGRLRAGGGRADVEARSVSAAIDLTFEAFTGLSVESISGDVTASGALDGDGGFDLDLHGGDVTLEVPGDVSADFRIETFSGDIENAFGQKARKTSKYTPGRSLEFSVGGGEARVRINTFSGDVVIRRR